MATQIDRDNDPRSLARSSSFTRFQALSNVRKFLQGMGGDVFLKQPRWFARSRNFTGRVFVSKLLVIIFDAVYEIFPSLNCPYTYIFKLHLLAIKNLPCERYR